MSASDNPMTPKTLIPLETIERRIYLIRRHKIMLDSDLAGIYGVSTLRLNEQVRRNAKRFPSDFMFQLSRTEYESLRSQIAISNTGRGGRRYLPYVFTEHGTVMLSAVLHTPVAIEASIQIARAFVKLREVLASHRELAAKLEAIERRLASHDAELGEHAKHIRAVFDAIRQLMESPKPPEEPETPRRPIGFLARKK